MAESGSKNVIQSAEKIFNLLEILTTRQSLSLTQLTALTGYSKSTTQRIVNTLKELKYIQQDPASLEYRPSLKLHELGSNTAKVYPINSVAAPYLLELYQATNETINLGIFENGQIVYTNKILTRHHLRADFEIGRIFPVACSAIGKCIAAFNDIRLFGRIDFPKYTDKSIDNMADLSRELELVRKNGYAVDNEEFVPGLVCIGMPVMNKSGEAVAAIGISYPSHRFNDGVLNEALGLLGGAVAGIEREI